MRIFIDDRETSSDIWLRTEVPLRPPTPPRARTPPTNAAAGPSRLFTPEPDEGKVLIINPRFPGLTPSNLDHWLFHERMWTTLQTEVIPFYIRGIRGSGSKALDRYDGVVARTMPAARWDLPPADGEVIVSVPMNGRQRGVKQISINPKFLVPLEPEEEDNVVVIREGDLFTATGTVKRKDGDNFVVEFFKGKEFSVEKSFTREQLAVSEEIP